MKPYKDYAPKTVEELSDHVGAMVIMSPVFKDKTGHFPHSNLETIFVALYEGLENNRSEIGEDMYFKLKEMSDQMRVLYESDPREETGDARKGRKINIEAEKILDQYLRDQANKRTPI